MNNLNLVELKNLPTEVGTEFVIVTPNTEDTLSKIVSYVCRVTSNSFELLNFELQEWETCHISESTFSESKVFALPHAELRAKYKNLGSTPKDWQYYDQYLGWLGMDKQPLWYTDIKYRYNPIPKRIMIGSVEVPAPETKNLTVGTTYFTTNLNNKCLFNRMTWNKDIYDLRLLNRGFIHLNEESAQLHTKAILKLLGVKV